MSDQKRSKHVAVLEVGFHRSPGKMGLGEVMLEVCGVGPHEQFIGTPIDSDARRPRFLFLSDIIDKALATGRALSDVEMEVRAAWLRDEILQIFAPDQEWWRATEPGLSAAVGREFVRAWGDAKAW